MAAEEDKTKTAAPDAAAPAANGKGGEATNGKKKNNNREDQTPIEELYDLSKPIPRVSKYPFLAMG